MVLDDIDAANNLVELFLKRADENGDKPFLGAKRQGSWQTISWREAADQVCVLAESLRGLGLVDGDRVALVSENRPEWCIADLGIMAAGCITVPAYTTNTERDHQHILDNSGAKAVIVFEGLVWNTNPGACEVDPPVANRGPQSTRVTSVPRRTTREACNGTAGAVRSTSPFCQ